MNLNRLAFIESIKRTIEEDRIENVRPVLIHGRRIEGNVDPTQIPVKERVDLRDPDTGNFFFVPGYDDPDGDSIIA